jgi:2-polyprenyl-3-methyl-5-hydroxy-6-metoxy-1,4-benzoquinol methylase
MATNTPTIDYRDDYYRGAARVYFERVLRTVIDMGDLRRAQGPILDFGCGVGHLKRSLKDKTVIGYDVIPELSEIEDYRRVKPDAIVLVSVLEHIPRDDIERLLRDFLTMNRNARLVVAVPTENAVSRIAMRLAGQPHAHDDHVLKYRDINSIVETLYAPIRRRHVFFRMTQVTLYRAKEDRPDHAIN